MNSQALTTVLVPFVTGVVGALGVIWQDWRQRRSVASWRKLAFEDAIRQVNFVEQWWRVHHTIAPSNAQGQDTTAPLLFLTNALQLAKSVEPPEPGRDALPLMRRFWLVYALHRRSAQILRVVFYLLAAFLVLIALLELGNLLAGQVDTREGLAWQLIFAIVFAIGVLVIRFTAVSLDEAPERQARPASSSPVSTPHRGQSTKEHS